MGDDAYQRAGWDASGARTRHEQALLVPLPTRCRVQLSAMRTCREFSRLALERADTDLLACYLATENQVRRFNMSRGFR